jgi:predicted nuclease of predicted toxin-antitoxin system
MKLLLDACISQSARVELQAVGHDAEQIGVSEADPGDDAVIAKAHGEGRVLVTLDKDFGELTIVHGRPHAGIVRLVGISAKRQGAVCNTVVEQYRKQLTDGAIVTVEPGRVRVRPSSDDSG